MLPITSNYDAAVPAGTSVPVNDPQTCRSVGCYANLVGEPDAANPHVRFDERGVETEHGGILGHRQPKGPATRKATPKPPRHSSTLPPDPEGGADMPANLRLEWCGGARRDDLGCLNRDLREQ